MDCGLVADTKVTGLLLSTFRSLSFFVMVEGLAGVLAAAGDSSLAGDNSVDTVDSETQIHIVLYNMHNNFIFTSYGS